MMLRKGCANATGTAWRPPWSPTTAEAKHTEHCSRMFQPPERWAFTSCT